MPSPVRRRPRETDPVVAARLQAISYADPYVFVHASDVLDPELFDEELFDEPAAGWVPRAPDPPPTPPPPLHTTEQIGCVAEWSPAPCRESPRCPTAF